MQKFLDLGVERLLIPQIRIARDDEEVVQLSKYTPRRNRGFCSAVRATGCAASGDYRQQANDQTLILEEKERKKTGSVQGQQT